MNNDPKDNPWIIQKNTHNSGGICVGTYTTNFTYNENENWIEAEGKNEYPTFDEFKNEMAIQYAINNSHNVTLRPHQQPYKHFQESQIFPKEMIWRSDLIRSVSDLPV